MFEEELGYVAEDAGRIILHVGWLDPAVGGRLEGKKGGGRRRAWGCVLRVRYNKGACASLSDPVKARGHGRIGDKAAVERRGVLSIQVLEKSQHASLRARAFKAGQGHRAARPVEGASDVIGRR